jgi:DNA polymerase-3 subunit gamma/tau
MKISAKENINIDQDAVALIVRSADGSVRDGLSLLDQAITSTTDKITSNIIIGMLGLADRGNIFDLMEAIFKGEAPNALEIFNRLHSAGADVVMIFDEMLNIVHFLTQIKIVPELKDDIHIPELERVKGAELAENISMGSLGMVWQILFKGFEELHSGFHLFQHGEMIIIRLIYLYEGPNPEELIKKSTLENVTDNKSYKNISVIDSQEKNNPVLNQISTKIYTADNLDEKIENNPSLRGGLKIESYRHFVDLFYQKREAMLHTYLYNNAKLISFKEGELIIDAKFVADSHFTRTIAKLVSTWTGRIWQVNTSSSNIGKSLYEEDLIEQHKEIELMKDDIEVKKLLDTFPGVKIHSITSINQTPDENELLVELNQKEEK